MSPTILITGPEDLLTFKAPRPPTELQGRATTAALDTTEAEVVVCINGQVQYLECFEEVEVSAEIVEVLRNSGAEFEVVEETEKEEER